MTADGTPCASRSVAAECRREWKFTSRTPASWHWRRSSRRRFDGDSGVPVSDDQTRPRFESLRKTSGWCRIEHDPTLYPPGGIAWPAPAPCSCRISPRTPRAAVNCWRHPSRDHCQSSWMGWASLAAAARRWSDRGWAGSVRADHPDRVTDPEACEQLVGRRRGHPYAALAGWVCGHVIRPV